MRSNQRWWGRSETWIAVVLFIVVWPFTGWPQGSTETTAATQVAFSASELLTERIDATHQRFADLANAVPRVRGEVDRGEQFVVRRRAYAEIKKEFSAAGIEFAVPTVRGAGSADDHAAASASGQVRHAV